MDRPLLLRSGPSWLISVHLRQHTRTHASSCYASQYLRVATGCPSLKLCLRAVSRGFAFSKSEGATSIPPGTNKGDAGVGTRINPLCHLPRWLITVQWPQRIVPLFVPPLVRPIGCRPLEAFDPGFQSGIPWGLTLPLQPYFVLSTSGQRGPWVGTGTTVRSRYC
jgi:hypothetical protein